MISPDAALLAAVLSVILWRVLAARRRRRPSGAGVDLRVVHKRRDRERERLLRARMGVDLPTIVSWDAETRRRVVAAIRGEDFAGSG